jgi:hypothetical protein
LHELRSVLEDIPVNDPSLKWDRDEQTGHWVNVPPPRQKTRKTLKSIVLYDATKEHPAQVDKFTVDERIGQWEARDYSGMVTGVRKRQILNRVDELILATKRARMRANDTETVPVRVSRAIFDYILQDKE